MAKQQASSGIAAKLGAAGNAAFEAHKNDEVRLSNAGNLPPGIENGIAELRKVTFGEYKEGELKGKPFFMASAIVLEPESITVDGREMPIKGLRTQIGPEALCDTPKKSRKTLDDHIAWVTNQMKLMGVDTSTITINEWDAVAEALMEQKPQIRFRTWQMPPATEGPYKGKPSPVNHEWRGTVDNPISVSESEVQDNTGEEAYHSDDVSTGEEATEESIDVTAVAAVADGDPGEAATVEAQQQLDGIARELGIDPDEIQTWGEVATLILAAQGGGGDESGATTAAAGDDIPKKGEFYYYMPPSAKKGQKASEVEITAVFEGTKTCNAKDAATKVVFKGIKWPELLGEQTTK